MQDETKPTQTENNEQQSTNEPQQSEQPQIVTSPQNPKPYKKIALAILAVIILALAGYGAYSLLHKSSSTPVATATTSSSTPSQKSSTSTKTPAKVNSINMAKLPLGDGKVTTAGAKQGYVYSCTSSFKGGGAQHSGSWISGSTWNETAKPTVNGSVSWPNATFSATLSGSNRILSGNGLPVNTETGIFPIQSGTTAYQYDRNPNSITAYNVSYTLPANPTVASSPSCVGLGPIGYMLNGVALFNALDASGRDAAAHEIQDKCSGHPQSKGIYHYHSMSGCIPNEDANNKLVGYALDGFGIYSDRSASGKQYTTADLDACHGITSKIMWNGKMVNMYHYVLTEDYPYSIGCFRGTPVRTAGQNTQASQQGPAPNQRPIRG